MSGPENSLAVPEVEVGKEKSYAKDDFWLFLLFMYLNGVSIFRYRCGLSVMSYVIAIQDY